jgi:competence protein ComEC
MEILCFFAGIACYCLKSNYPVGLLLTFLFFRPRWALIGCFLAGLSFSVVHERWVAPQGFPESSVIGKADLRGSIVSIPLDKQGQVQFQFMLDELNGHAAHALLNLSCYDHCPTLRAGETWRVMTKLKKPHNLGNPGGFDYVGSLHARHVEWTGYTRRGSFQRMEARHFGTHAIRWRQRLAEKLAELNPDPHTIGILQALTLGVSYRMDKDTWGLFRRTGTTHLMVISGAHIGLVAGLTYALLKWLWCRFSRLPQWIPAQRMASVGGFLMALLYTLLAGFGVPAQRALIVCGVMLFRQFFNHRLTVWQAWRYALLVVIIYEPHATLLPGFYLSFLAVAILIGMSQRIRSVGFKKNLMLQLACLMGLMPLTLYWFSYGSLNSLFANLVAIPWVSFVIIPLGLVATLLGLWVPMSWVIWVVNWAITYLLIYLHWIDSLSVINLNFSLSSPLPLLALILTLILAVFFPMRTLAPAGVVLMLSGLFFGHKPVPPGSARIDVLDVGQGLAVVVRTARHTLVYDTGVQFYKGGDMGQLALVPFLKSQGIKSLDKVVISHPDLDHRGGLLSLMAVYSMDELLVDDPSHYKQPTASCHEYPAWNWDEVTFRFFPIQGDFKGKNNRSCVLQVSNAAGQVLLTGDIERPAETYLVHRYGQTLASSVLVIPHHGSKTSSSSMFVEVVAPTQAVVSYGFDNRYHFPHQQAMRVYQTQHIPVYATEACGLIRIDLKKGANTAQVMCSQGQVK